MNPSNTTPLAARPGNAAVGPARLTVGPARLALLMFFQLFSQGAFSPVLSMYLKEGLHFSGSQTGVILAGAVITALLAPLFALWVIDRLLSARSLLILCHSLLLVLAAALSQARDFSLFLVLYVAYQAFAGPTIGLVNALAFQHVPGGSRAFGGLRLYGTLGWIAASWLISLLWVVLPGLVAWPAGQGGPGWYPLIWAVSAAGSLVTILSAWSLPRGKSGGQAGGQGGVAAGAAGGQAGPATGPAAGPSAAPARRAFIPPETRAIFRKPEILILCGIYLLSSVLDRFYTFGTGPFFHDLGIGQAWIMPVMTLGQISEVFVLLGLARLLGRVSYRRLMLAGMVIQVLRFALYTSAWLPLALVGVSLNGFIFAWLYTCITMYVDSHTADAERAGVHQILVFVFGGISSLIGNISAGLLNDRSPAGSLAGWQGFWLVPTLGGLAILGLMLVFFVRSRRDEARHDAAGPDQPAAPPSGA